MARKIKKPVKKRTTKKKIISSKPSKSKSKKDVKPIPKINKSKSLFSVQDIDKMFAGDWDDDEYDFITSQTDNGIKEQEKDKEAAQERQREGSRETQEGKEQEVWEIERRIDYLSSQPPSFPVQETDISRQTDHSKDRSPSSERLPDHIKEYFVQVEASKEAINSKEIFRADEDNIDIKTELSDMEIQILNRLMINDKILLQHGLIPVFSLFSTQFMRLKISRNRQSRQEFVDINRQNNTDQMLSGLQGLSNVSSIQKAQR